MSDPDIVPVAQDAAKPAFASTGGTTPRAVRKKPKKRDDWRDTVSFLLKLIVIVYLFRSLLFSPFNIPSESMLPRLYIGDYLFISKWNYGYSRHSLPWSWPPVSGRLLAQTPQRGDVVVFKAPPKASEDYIKRVIGLPRDTIQMKNGQLILNGRAVPKVRIADFVIPISPNFNETDNCRPPFLSTDARGQPVCRYPQYRETLPGGRSYFVLDRGDMGRADNTELFTVPAGHVFLMGDNRDDSEDSRFAQDEGGIGFVPMENLEGKAVVTFWSTDGSAQWLLPWTWFTAARWSRVGQGF